MAYRKSGRNQAFTVVYNEVAQHKDMSMEAKGLLLFMLSLPEDWEYHKNWLQDQCPGWGREKLAKILKELEKLGFLIRTPKRSDDGKKLAGWDWEVLSESVLEAEIRQTRYSDKEVRQTRIQPDLRVSSQSGFQSDCQVATTNKTLNKKNKSSSKPEQTQGEFNFDLVLAWLITQLAELFELTKSDLVFIEASLEEYVEGATKPTKARAFSWIEQALTNRMSTQRRSMQASAGRDEKNRAVVKNLRAQADHIHRKTRQITPKITTKDKILDTSWSDDKDMFDLMPNSTR